MCGRFALTAAPEEVEHVFAVAEIGDFPPRYNIAPTQPIMMVEPAPTRPAGSNLPERQAVLVRWGFIPAWAKKTEDVSLMINARSESAATKPSFRTAMRHRRTLIPASGFYEWRKLADGRRQAYWLRPRDGGLIAFGGLMESYCEPGGSEIDTGAILTTRASADIRDIHDRMPVVIKPEDFSHWLNCRTNEPRHVAELMQPMEEGFFEAIPVSEKVNKVTNSSPELQDRVDAVAERRSRKKKEPDPQLLLF